MGEFPNHSDKQITVVRRSSSGRPAGISILAVLHFGCGVFLIVAPFLLMEDAHMAAEFLLLGRAQAGPVMVGLASLFILLVASGVGMWFGTAWGWFLGAYYYVHSAFRNSCSLLFFLTTADTIDDAAGRDAEYYALKYGLRITFNVLFFLYFWNSRVLAFYNLEDIHKPKVVGLLVGIGFVVMALGFLPTWLGL